MFVLIYISEITYFVCKILHLQKKNWKQNSLNLLYIAYQQYLHKESDILLATRMRVSAYLCKQAIFVRCCKSLKTFLAKDYEMSHVAEVQSPESKLHKISSSISPHFVAYAYICTSSGSWAVKSSDKKLHATCRLLC